MEKSFYHSPVLKNEDDVLRFFQHAIAYRENHKDESEAIAQFVFDATFEGNLDTQLSPALENIRYEFGALEAPGTSDKDEENEVFEDKLWQKLSQIVKKLRER